MKTIKTSLALLIGAALLTGCNDDDTKYVNVQPTEVKIATYNLSFDRATFEALVNEMQIEPSQLKTKPLRKRSFKFATLLRSFKRIALMY